MKKVRLINWIVAIAVSLIACSKDDETGVTGISVDKKELSLMIGETQQLVATVTPENAAPVEWSSSDTTIVTVNETGLVTAVAVGNAKITASAGGFSADCQVTVSDIPVESVTLYTNEQSLNYGESFELKATVLPANAPQTISWTSSDEKVATVDEKGVITAVGYGEATITATAGDKTATCLISIISEYKVSTQADIEEALANVSDNPNYPTKIILNGDIELNSTIVITDPEGKERFIVFDGQGHKVIRKMNDQMFEVHKNQTVTFQKIALSGGNLITATTFGSVDIQGGTVILDGGFKYTEFEYNYETAFRIRSEENIEGVLRVKKDIDISGNGSFVYSLSLSTVEAGKVILEDVETNGTLYFTTDIPEAFVMTSSLSCYVNINANTIHLPGDPGEIKDGDIIVKGDGYELTDADLGKLTITSSAAWLERCTGYLEEGVAKVRVELIEN